MTSEWMAGDGPAHLKSKSRHLCTWEFDAAATSPSLVCRICVPYSELSTADQPESLKAVRWCEGLDPSQAGYFIVYCVPQFPEDAVIEMPHQPVAGFHLKNGRGILVCAEKLVMSAENLAQLKQGRTELRELAARGGIQQAVSSSPCLRFRELSNLHRNCTFERRLVGDLRVPRSVTHFLLCPPPPAPSPS
jgi:hypothetical protein